MTDDGVTGGHVDALRASVDRLQVSVDDERAAREAETATLARKQVTAARAIRRSNVAIGAVVVILVCGLLAQWGQSQSLRHEVDRREAERSRAAVVSCQNANITRQAIEDRFQSFIDVLVAVSPKPPTAEGQMAQDGRVATLRAEFAARRPESLGPRDCSPAAVNTPTTLTTLAPGS
jgi:hypothetical protein